MTTGTINYDRFEAAIVRNRNRRMCYELLGQFFWRALAEHKLETAATIREILDRFYCPHP